MTILIRGIMCTPEFGNSSIPCLIRQSSVGDYLLVHEQAPSLVRADPVYFPKGFVNRMFHKNALVSAGVSHSASAGHVWQEPPAPIAVQNAMSFVSQVLW